MKLSETNLFDKGLSLDLNPANVDNHSLTAALNATMISRNGNEMVLQNDMGNAKVESAYLPAGYVPVGMKEYGGIVYVASYNPITGYSLIGSFPSPETNISSDENKSNSCEFKGDSDFIDNGVIVNTYKKVVLIDNTLNSGDKFQVIAEDTNKSGLLEMIKDNIIDLRVVLCSDSGENFDITDTCIKYQYTYTDSQSKKQTIETVAYCGLLATKYSLSDILIYDSGTNSYVSINTAISGDTYKSYYNVIKQGTGKLYLAEQLIVPDFINSGISIKVDSDGNYVIKFNPKAYKLVDDGISSNYILWDNYEKKNDFNYKISYTVNNVTKVLTESDNNQITLPPSSASQYLFTYEVSVLYSEAVVNNLISTDILDLKNIPTGEVKVSKFRYYNTYSSTKSYIDFYYTISSFLEESDSIDLKLEYKEYSNNFSYTDFKEKQFDSPQTGFGTYIQRIYFNNDLQLGKIYIGRLKAQTTEKTTYSDYFIIITSTITNVYYFNNPDDNMFPINSSGITLTIPCEVTCTYSETKGAKIDSNTHSEKVPSVIPSTKEFSNISVRDELRELTITPTVELTNLTTSNLVSVSCSITGINDDEGSSDFKLEGSLSRSGATLLSDFYKVSESLSNNKVTIDSEITSKFYANLDIADESATGNDKYKFTQTTSDATVLMPYVYPIDGNATHLNELEDLFGGTILTKTNSAGKEIAFPTRWITYRAYAANFKHWSKFGLVNAEGHDYLEVHNGGVRINLTTINSFPEMAGVGETNDYGTYTFSDLQNTSCDWGNICTQLTQYVKNDLNVNPTFLAWQAHNERGTNNAVKGNIDLRYTNYLPLAIYDNSSTISRDNTNWNAPGKDYSYLFMKGTNSDWFLLVDPDTHKLGIAKGVDNSCIMWMIDLFKNIYIPKSHQELTYNYYKASSKSQDYVYSNPFTLNVRTSFNGTINKTNKYTNSSNITLPTFTLSLTTFVDSYTSEFSAIDLVEDNLDYLEVTPSFLNIALIYNSNTQSSSQITTAYNPSTNLQEALSMQSPYVYDEVNDRLIRCKSGVSLPSSLGNKIASGICSGDIVMKQNSTTEQFELLINSGDNKYDSLMSNNYYKKKVWDLTCNTTDGIAGNNDTNFRPKNSISGYYPMFFGSPTLNKNDVQNNNSLSLGDFEAGLFGYERCNSSSYIFEIIDKVYTL